MTEPQSFKRNPTQGDCYRDQLIALVAANPGVVLTGSYLATALGVSAPYFWKLRKGLLDAGKLVQLATLRGPGGGSVYTMPESQ